MIQVTIRLPAELVEEFDKTCKENGYTFRTNGFEDAMREFIQHKK